MVIDLKKYQSDCVDAFKIMCSKEDIRTNPEAKKLARYINRQGRKIDRITRLQIKLFDC